MSPRLEFVTCASPAGLHRMAYWEWGRADNPDVLLCLHGLTRSGRDFDRLARSLAQAYRVICPDLAGRGRSDWLANPMFYTVPQYVADIVTLLARIQPERLNWLGTSLGGLVGMALGGAVQAAHALRGGHATPEDAHRAAPDIRFGKLVLNDVGPRLNPPALARIGQYVGRPVAFDSFDAAVENVRTVAAEFGPHTDEQWRELTEHVYRKEAQQWVKHYDLGISVPFMAQDPGWLAAGEQLLWQSYESLDCPILIVRGEQSDLLTEATAQEMLARNAHASLHEVHGVGHAPTLMHDAQIEPVVRFLLDSSPASPQGNR
jgi:pimeloyl-ACP methyl ester carboxylesterase